MTPAELAARCVELLGAIDGPIAVDAPAPVRAALAARAPVAPADGAVAGAVCVFLGEAGDAAARGRRLSALAARLAAAAPLVVADHNQPRVWWRRALGAVVLLAAGASPARARVPVAREIRDRGFTIDRLRLAAGERVQLVVAHRREVDGPDPRAAGGTPP